MDGVAIEYLQLRISTPNILLLTRVYRYLNCLVKALLNCATSKSCLVIVTAMLYQMIFATLCISYFVTDISINNIFNNIGRQKHENVICLSSVVM